MERVEPFFLACQVCGKSAVYHISEVQNRQLVKEYDLCEPHGQSLLKEIHFRPKSGLASPQNIDGMTRFDIDLLIAGKDQSDAIYYLREDGGERVLITTMDYYNLVSLYRSISRSVTSRPSTFNSYANTIESLGGVLQDVVINEYSVDSKVFYADLRILCRETLITLDVRPSDAINLAVVCDVPIYVSEIAWRAYVSAHRSK